MAVDDFSDKTFYHVVHGKIFAHRGLHGKYSPRMKYSVPENSLKAFELAGRFKIPIELDVHMMADGTLVVFHDDDLERMTGAHGKLAELEYKQISHLGLLTTEGHLLKEQKISKFDADFLRNFKGQFLLIELKYDTKDYKKFARAVMDVLNESGKSSNEYTLQSFDARIVRYLNRKKFATGLLLTKQKGLKRVLNLRIVSIFARAKFLSVDKALVKKRRIQHYRDKHGPVVCWTVRSVEDFHELSEYADAIICEKIFDQLGFANQIRNVKK